MKYMGSKNRLAKDILPIILKNREEGQVYVEPFVGGCNLIDKVTGPRIGNDINTYLIECWKALQEGWIPRDDYTKEEYLDIKNNPDRDPHVTGWVGINCSYSGKWFGGFAGVVNTAQGVRDYQKEAFRNTIKQVPNISKIKFLSVSFDELELPDNCIIYCDPPYKGVTKYKNTINHEKFYEWCIQAKESGHEVFISEYSMPEPFKLVWKKGMKSSLSANGSSGGSKSSTECLFTL